MPDNSYKFLRDCRIRHYQNMTPERAKKVLRELKSKKQRDDFRNRINKCKGYEFI